MITAQFNDSFPPITDGVANGVRNYALWLNRKYGKTYAVVPEYPGYTDNEEFEVIRFVSIPYLSRKPYRIGLPEISLKAKKRLAEIQLDIVHARTPFSSGVFAQKIANEKNIPLVASFHSQYYYDIKDQVKSERLTQRLLKEIAAFYETADAVWTVSGKTADTLRSYGYQGDIDIVGNGIDLEKPHDYMEIRHAVDLEFGFSKDTFVMLYVGQMIWHKNLRLVAEGLAAVKKAGRDYRMLFIGDGKDSQGLKELVRELGLEDRVNFLGRINDRKRVMSMYARGDLFLFPSIYDTFGIVVREAAAMECPCILVEGSNAAEDINDCCNGFLCEDNVESFSGAIMKVMDDRELLEKVGKEAAQTLPESWEEVVDKVYNKYCNVINDFRGRR